MTMDQGAEGQTILQTEAINTSDRLKRSLPTHLEGQMEVLDVDVLVGRRLALAPQQQTLLGGHLLDGNVLDGESQDDGPDHTQSHLQVAVDNLLGADRHQLHALGGDKVQRFVHVGDLQNE